MNIFKPNSFIKTKYSKDHLNSLLTSSSVIDNILGLRYILCKIQESYDYTSEIDTIIKLIDTTNHVLKKLTNEYLRYYFLTTADDERKLLIVNTILKDLIDMEDITIDYLVEFSTPSIIQTYLQHINKYIAKKKSKKSYELAYNCDRIFNTNLVKSISPDYSSIDYLNLVSFTDLNLPEDQLELNLYDTDKLKCVLRKMYYNKEVRIDKKTLEFLLKKDDITVFYYTFKLVVDIYPDLLQKAYEISLVHLNNDNETLYHLLILHENILNKVQYNNSSYLIYYSDPDYIKKQKIKILFNNLDEISLREIRRYKYLEIIEHTILKDCTEFEDVFYKNEYAEVIRIIYQNDIKGVKMNYIVQKYLLHVMDYICEMKEEILRMFVYLCSIYLNENLLPKIQANFNTILSYYLNLYKRDLITKSEICSSLKIYTEYKDKVKIICELINKDVSSLLYFSDEIKINKVQNIKIDLYNNLMECKPYLENTKLPRKSIKKPSLSHYLPDSSKLINLTQLKKRCTLSTLERVFINHKYIKGVLTIQKSRLLLIIDVLEKDTIIEYTINKLVDKLTLSSESKVDIIKINEDIKLVQLKIYDDIYEIKIDWTITPNLVNKDKWENEYNRLTKYKLVDKFDMTGVFKIDDERFSFKIFDEEVFGRVYNNQIILKGNQEIVDKF